MYIIIHIHVHSTCKLVILVHVHYNIYTCTCTCTQYVSANYTIVCSHSRWLQNYDVMTLYVI